MYVGLPSPTNVKATVLTPHSVEVKWDQLSDADGYFISCISPAIYADSKNVMVNGNDATGYTLTDLVEDTPYYITLQGLGRKGFCSTKVSVTYIVGKWYMTGKSFRKPQHMLRLTLKSLFLLA